MSVDDIISRLWPAHKLKHNVVFEQVEDERRRILNFKENHIFIDNHNMHKKTHHYCGHNQFSHWSYDEYLSWLSVKTSNHEHIVEPANKKITKPITLSMGVKGGKTCIPSAVNWKAQGKITNVKQQGKCGSGWAFSVVGSVESIYAIKTGQLINFSEQQLLDCNTDNYGCNGGWPDVAFKYVVDYGIMREKDYPYIAKKGDCHYNPKDVVKIKNYKQVEYDDWCLMEACAYNGPISISVNATGQSFIFYKGGIYYDPTVPCAPVTHSLLLAGYGYRNDESFWFAKNSWGLTWGEQGYIFIFLDMQNYLGVHSLAYYPIY